jgi:chromosome segregation ATPase
MSDEQQAALAARDARIAELEAGWDAETVKRQVADFNKLCDEIRRLRDDLAAREAELAGWKEEAERSHRNVAYWQAELARLREHLQSLQATCDRNAERANRFAAEATKAEAELATLRGALELAERDEDGRCNVCGHETSHWDTCEVGNALSTPPRRTPEGER